MMCHAECISITDDTAIPPQKLQLQTVQIMCCCILSQNYKTTPTIDSEKFLPLTTTTTYSSQSLKVTGTGGECQCAHAGVNDEVISTVPQTRYQTIFSTTNTKASPQFATLSCLHQCDTISGVLGALVGLLLLLLSVVTTGWAWTCWTMKKRVRYIYYRISSSYGTIKIH